MQKLNEELQLVRERIAVLHRKIDDYESTRYEHWVHSFHRKNEKEYKECKNREKQLLSKIKEYQECHDILKNKIVFMITNDLTIGRNDNDLEIFTSEQIENFIKEHDAKIEAVIQNIIDDYDKDGEIELLRDPLLDWIGEYLYEDVKTIPLLEK